MHVELFCPRCRFHFRVRLENSPDEMLDRISTDRFGCGLGEGETVEDLIHAALTEQGDIECSECGGPAVISEESLGRMAMQVLAHY